MLFRAYVSFLLFLMATPGLANSTSLDVCRDNTEFNVGAGIYDITGPIAEQRMMGYAMLDQQDSGMYSRLWARAFVIESPCNNKRIVFVNADLGQLFQAVKEEVVHKLQAKYGDLYTDKNVLITATHQHSGPGGYSTYTLYNLTILGFSKENFNTIVTGIVAAIERAQKNMTMARIRFSKGELKGVSFNRSPQSYLLNPQTERDHYSADVDTEMTMLRFDSVEGKPIGIITWFPVHGVSMNNKNHLVNSDNKGYAEYLFEKDFNSDYGPTAFVAAFAQANAGDVSPNELGKEGGSGLEGLIAVDKTGRPQYGKAKELYATATQLVTGGIDYRHTFVEMDKINIDPNLTDGEPHTTCPAALGLSMLAGTADGEGLGQQGMTCDKLKKTLPGVICDLMTTDCQGVKPIALDLQNKFPYPWVPSTLPFQLLKVGNVIIAAVPFELTTMSGRRLKHTLEKVLPDSQKYHITLSTLANAYVQYVTTNEEYQLQRYEGASTLFGPWSLAAIQQQFIQLSQALINDKEIDAGPTPLDLLGFQINLQSGVLFDGTPLGKHFGEVYQDVNSVYKAGATVQAIFWGAHPKNNFRTQDSFLEVQRWENNQWLTVRYDRDWDTEYHWQRNGIANSLITIVWHTPKEIPSGYYRLVQHGDWKAFFTGKITPYNGYSSAFWVG